MDEAIQWINKYPAISDSGEVLLEDAAARVLAEPFVSPTDAPPFDMTARDGYALRSAETVGAGSYNPLPFCIQNSCLPLSPHSAALVLFGMPLPQGADAVAPFDLVHAGEDNIDLLGTIAQGDGVTFQGQETSEGTTLIDISRPLRPADLGLLASFGVERVRVVRRPRVRLILAGRKTSGTCKLTDANGPMLRAAVARDGGVIEASEYGVTTRTAIADLISRPGADVVIVCGRTGAGPDDEAPLALGIAGTLSIHGIALQPGGSTGMGSVEDVPVILLPGNPLDCLCAYDLFAGQLIRRLGGRSSQLPYGLQHATVGRRIVSSIGNLELCRVRLVEGKVVPLGTANSGGLVSAARADGFVLVPAPLEGYAPGAPVAVYLYDEACGLDGIGI
jgi:molybdopterin molybdotransferase